MEGLRRFLSRPIGWAVFQVALLFLVLLLSRLAAELFGSQAFGITLIALAIVAGIVSYLIRRRFLRSTGWGFDDDDQADDRSPPGA